MRGGWNALISKTYKGQSSPFPNKVIWGLTSGRNLHFQNHFAVISFYWI